LAFHLSHGISSVFQTLGWNTPRYSSLIRYGGLLVTAVIVGGNILIALAVQTGFVR
jgi:succinate dehydrogenase / fumarate reductase cytochrome b subunit